MCGCHGVGMVGKWHQGPLLSWPAPRQRVWWLYHPQWSPSPTVSRKHPIFPLLLRDVTQLWMDEGPRHCTHKATLQGHGATHPQVSLCGHRVSLGPPHMYSMRPMPWLPTPLQQEFEVVSSSLNPTQ